jgi:serine/threonine protein kinase
MVEGQHLLRSEDLPILRSKRLIDVKARLQRALSVEYAAEVITRLLSFDPKDRCSLEWILEHPFLQKENIPIYLKVFSVNRATALTLLLNVPRGPRYVQYLIEELNRKVPPFPPKRSAHSRSHSLLLHIAPECRLTGTL